MSVLGLLQRLARPGSPLILCYHAVSSTWSSSLAVSARLLSEHMDSLHRSGYFGLTFGEADRLCRREALPRLAVAVTFDDAFASVERAVPILDEVGFPATVFAVTDFCDGGLLAWPELERHVPAHPEELRALSWERLQKLQEQGWEIGSHTRTHPWLTRLDDARLAAELAPPRAGIVDGLGVCETLAYPFGAANERVAAAARQAGYLAACTLGAPQRPSEPHRRPRAGLYPADAGLRARLKLSPSAVKLR